MSTPLKSPRLIELRDSDLLVLMSDHSGAYIYANDSFLKLRNWRWEDIKGTQTAKSHLDGNPTRDDAACRHLDSRVTIRTRHR
jgi:hypothetical protein